MIHFQDVVAWDLPSHFVQVFVVPQWVVAAAAHIPPRIAPAAAVFMSCKLKELRIVVIDRNEEVAPVSLSSRKGGGLVLMSAVTGDG